jgi:hypothetical protein
MPLDIPPDVDTEETLIQHPPQMLPQTASTIVVKVDASRNQFQSGVRPQVFYVYGRIRYLSTIEPEKTTPHETRFLNWSYPAAGFVPIPPSESEHSKYNQWS